MQLHNALCSDSRIVLITRDNKYYREFIIEKLTSNVHTPLKIYDKVTYYFAINSHEFYHYIIIIFYGVYYNVKQAA